MQIDHDRLETGRGSPDRSNNRDDEQVFDAKAWRHFLAESIGGEAATACGRTVGATQAQGLPKYLSLNQRLYVVALAAGLS